jgi:hypothetical protein
VAGWWCIGSLLTKGERNDAGGKSDRVALRLGRLCTDWMTWKRTQLHYPVSSDLPTIIATRAATSSSTIASIAANPATIALDGWLIAGETADSQQDRRDWRAT